MTQCMNNWSEMQLLKFDQEKCKTIKICISKVNIHLHSLKPMERSDLVHPVEDIDGYNTDMFLLQHENYGKFRPQGIAR